MARCIPGDSVHVRARVDTCVERVSNEADNVITAIVCVAAERVCVSGVRGDGGLIGAVQCRCVDLGGQHGRVVLNSSCHRRCGG